MSKSTFTNEHHARIYRQALIDIQGYSHESWFDVEHDNEPDPECDPHQVLRTIYRVANAALQGLTESEAGDG